MWPALLLPYDLSKDQWKIWRFIISRSFCSFCIKEILFWAIQRWTCRCALNHYPVLKFCMHCFSFGVMAFFLADWIFILCQYRTNFIVNNNTFSPVSAKYLFFIRSFPFDHGLIWTFNTKHIYPWGTVSTSLIVWRLDISWKFILTNTF